MKFLEDEPNRLLKRCQTIYKALKSGTVKMDDGRVFEYDLIKPTFSIVGRKKWETIVHYYPHGFHLQYDRTPRTLSIEDVDNYVDTIHSPLNVKITTDYGKPIPRETIKKKIQEKFRGFGIFLSYGEVKFKKTYTPEPTDNINEEVSNEEYGRILKRLKTRARLIYKALGEGHVVVNCGDGTGLNFSLIKLRYVLPENPRVNLQDLFDDNDKIVSYGTLMAGDTIKMYYTPPNTGCEIDYLEAVEPIKKKFKSLGIHIVFDGIDLIEEQPLNEAEFKKPNAPKFTPEEEERLKKKINVVVRACTQFPITVAGHKVNVNILGYSSTIKPPQVVKYNSDEYDRPVYQVTEPELRIIVPQLYLETNSNEAYNLLTKVDEIDLNYEVYGQLAARFKKFKIGFSFINVRFVNKDNDLQEQLDNPDDDDEYHYTDNGTPSQEKKIRAIYKALKEGYLKIRFDGELYKFKYVLPNKFGVKYSKVSRDMTLQIHKFSFDLYDSNNVLINPYNPINKQLHLAAYRLISKRFQINFGVIFEEPPVGYDNYQNINGDLQEEVVSELTDKERKKVRAIFTAFKKGVFDLEDDRLKIRYHLISDYWIKKSSKEGRLTIILKGNSFENVIIHKIHSDGTETLVKPNGNMWNSLFYYVKSKIEKIFKQYDIDIKLI